MNTNLKAGLATLALAILIGLCVGVIFASLTTALLVSAQGVTIVGLVMFYTQMKDHFMAKALYDLLNLGVDED